MHKTKNCALVDLTVILNPFMMKSKRFSLGISLGTSSLFLCHPFHWMRANSGPAILVKYMGDWRAAFCWVCPRDPPSSLPLPPSLSQGSPAGFTFSKYHHSSPSRGAGGGGGTGWGYGRGPVTGQCVPLTPPLFFSTGCWEYRPLTQTAATLLSYTPYNGAPNLFRGGETCSLLLLPCSFTLVSCPRPILLFFSLSLCRLLPLTLLPHPFSPFPSSHPFSPHWGIIPPTLFRQSRAQRLGCPDSREEVAAYPSACPGPANEERGAEVLIHNNSH